MLRRGRSRLLPFVTLGLLCVAPVSAAELPQFEHHEIDPNVGKVCYALTAADVDGDGKQDIVAVTENRVLWYRNPDWKPRVIIENQTELDNVCIAPYDIDGDGQIDFALGAGWTKIGTIQWLSRGKSLDERWNVHLIGKEGWLHRMRFGDILGTGRPQLVISPLNKTVSAGVRLTAFEIPKNPKTDPWKATVLDESMNAMHNHWMPDLDGDGRTDLLTASREGVHLFRQGEDGAIQKIRLHEGAQDAQQPTGNGAGEIKTGKLAGNRPIIATIEPMHGNQVVVYTQTGNDVTRWTRHVLDDTLKRGHAIWLADIDRDGTDEVIVGHSDRGTGEHPGPGVFIYRAQHAVGTKSESGVQWWTRHVLDNGGVATEDIICEDFNGDGWIDIVAGGRGTHNVKVYMNRGR